jgi:hypothetical protein
MVRAQELGGAVFPFFFGGMMIPQIDPPIFSDHLGHLPDPRVDLLVNSHRGLAPRYDFERGFDKL